LSGGDAYGESSFGKPAFGAKEVSHYGHVADNHDIGYGHEADLHDIGYGQEADLDIGYGQEVDFGQDIGFGGSDYGQDDTSHGIDDLLHADIGHDDHDYGLDAIIDFDGADAYGHDEHDDSYAAQENPFAGIFNSHDAGEHDIDLEIGGDDYHNEPLADFGID